MIFQETFDYLFSQLAGAYDKNAIRRLKDYQRKRLRRAQIGLSIKPYYIEANWINASGAAGSEAVSSTQAVTKDLWVLDGALRQVDPNGFALDNTNCELWIRRTAGDSRVQPSKLYIKDVHMLTPAQAALLNISGARGQGAMWPFTWPVPLHLAPNELLQIKARALTGGTAPNRSNFAQFRCISVDNNAEDDSLIAELRAVINSRPVQRPIYLSMATPGLKTVSFPGTGLNQRTTAKTREATEHLLVLGYSMLLARDNLNGSSANFRWRLTSSDGYSFSREEVDCNCFAFAGPGFFYQAFPQPFLLKKGSSLAASFSTLTALTDAGGSDGQLYILSLCNLMKFKRNINQRDFLKIQTCEALERCQILSNEERYEQARFAQQVRNIWFTATAFPLPGTSAFDQDTKQAYSPAFSEPVIITDLLSMFDFKINQEFALLANTNNNTPRLLLQVREYGGDNSYGQDFFGLSSLTTTPQEFITKHEKNYSVQIGDKLDQKFADRLGTYLDFVPRLLKPYQRLQVQSVLNHPVGVNFIGRPAEVTAQLGFRGVRVLKPDNPYGYFTNTVDQRIKNYINGSKPETFFLDVQFPFANIPAVGLSMQPVKTEQNDRPLLVLGVISNLEGVQADLYDESKYYQFTVLDKRINQMANLIPLPAPEYTRVPLALWCPSSTFRNANSFNMFPVPHLLEPGAQFKITITNGLQPTTAVGTSGWQLSAATPNSQDVRITFICRTV